MSAGECRDGAAIFADLLHITNRMMEQRHDGEFLVAHIDKRQELIDEYERFGKADPEAKVVFEKTPEARRTVAKILDMDKVIFKALQGFRDEARGELKSSNAQQKVLGYVNNAISQSGHYMDYKK